MKERVQLAICDACLWLMVNGVYGPMISGYPFLIWLMKKVCNV